MHSNVDPTIHHTLNGPENKGQSAGESSNFARPAPPEPVRDFHEAVAYAARVRGLKRDVEAFIEWTVEATEAARGGLGAVERLLRTCEQSSPFARRGTTSHTYWDLAVRHRDLIGPHGWPADFGGLMRGLAGRAVAGRKGRAAGAEGGAK